MDVQLHVQNFLRHQGVEPNDGIVVGCSGGVDSMVLADVLYKLGYRIGLYHMNAGLRGKAADDDEKLVENWAVGMGIPFVSGKYKVKRSNGKSIQMNAREQRYEDYQALCKRWKMKWIATAHHKQDRLETTIMNWLRGTGIQGLSALRERRENILRPLLGCSKEGLYKWARKKSIPWNEDHSNQELKYARNRIRMEVIPAMEGVSERGLEGAYRTIDLLQEATDYLDEKLSEAVEDMVWWDGVQLRIEKNKFINNPHAGLLLHYILSPYGTFDKAGILQALDGQAGKRFYSENHELVVDREHLIVFERKEIPHRIVQLQKGVQKITNPFVMYSEIIDRKELDEIPGNRSVLCIDADKLHFPLTLRPWQNGDRFQPFGMKGEKKISDYLTDEKLPIHEKEKVYVLCSGPDIVWVVGYRPDDRYRINEETKLVYFAALKEPSI